MTVWEPQMKISLQIRKDGKTLYEGIHDVGDADGFGRACAAAWATMQERRMTKASSVGALFEALDETLLDELDGAQLRLSQL